MFERWDERVIWTLCGVVILLWALDLFSAVDSLPLMAIGVVVIGVFGLATIVASWSPWRSSDQKRSIWAKFAPWVILSVTLIGFLLWAFIQIYNFPGYGTDESAFDQFAAQLALGGINPYLHSMAPAFNLFHVSPDGYTLTMTGGRVTSLSYPALSFEIYMPFLALGWSSQLAIVADIVAWMISVVMMFIMLPKKYRALALIIGSTSIYIAYAVGGVTDALFIPFLIGASYRWNRFGIDQRLRTWIGPICFGLAMAIKQTPWLILPFVVIGIVIEVQSHFGLRAGIRSGVSYGMICLLSFLIPNIPYIISAPSAWLHGITTPLFSNTVPAGQGLIGLSLFLGIGGGMLTGFSITAGVLYVSLWCTYLVSYRRLVAWTFFLPSLVLFFASRSFGSYLVTLVPAALVAATSSKRRPIQEDLQSADDDSYQISSSPALADIVPSTDQIKSNPTPSFIGAWRHWRWVAIGGGLATLLSVGITLAVPGPMKISVVSVKTTGQLATIEKVTVRVTNQTGNRIHPAFSIESGGTLTNFWLISSGPKTLNEKSSANYTLLAPDFVAQPPITGGFQVIGFTSSPASASVSNPFSTDGWHVSLNPDAIDHVVPLNKTITIQAQILNRFDQPVHVGSIPIYMGQIIYDQSGLIYATTYINNAQQGQTPVSTLTNANGKATFRIRATSSPANNDPVYYEANLVNLVHFYPYGYSTILPIRFK